MIHRKHSVHGNQLTHHSPSHKKISISVRSGSRTLLQYSIAYHTMVHVRKKRATADHASYIQVRNTQNRGKSSKKTYAEFTSCSSYVCVEETDIFHCVVNRWRFSCQAAWENYKDSRVECPFNDIQHNPNDFDKTHRSDLRTRGIRAREGHSNDDR